MRNAGVVLFCLMALAASGCGSEAPPPAISLQPQSLTWAAETGIRAGYSVEVERSGGYAGPIQLELRGVPEGLVHEPVLLESEEDFAIMEIELGPPVEVGTYPMMLVASGGTLTDVAHLTLKVSDVTANSPVLLAFEPETPTVMRGGVHELTVQVNRVGGFRGGFRIEQGQPAPGMSVAAVSVARAAPRFTLTLTVEQGRSVGPVELTLTVRTAERTEQVLLPVEVVGP
ncbi:hypothetical protein ACLESD_09405 [Pyxidicoccus sp. 3LFB2]